MNQERTKNFTETKTEFIRKYFTGVCFYVRSVKKSRVLFPFYAFFYIYLNHCGNNQRLVAFTIQSILACFCCINIPETERLEYSEYYVQRCHATQDDLICRNLAFY